MRYPMTLNRGLPAAILAGLGLMLTGFAEQAKEEHKRIGDQVSDSPLAGPGDSPLYAVGETTRAGTEEAEPHRLTAFCATATIPKAAKEQREAALKLRQSTADIEIDIVAPDAWKAAEADLTRSQAFWDDKEYETAGFGYRMAITKYKEALLEFERVAGQRHSIWVDWAKQRAEQVKVSSLVTATWLAIADSLYSMGDADGYKTAIGRAIASVAAGGLLDPAAGAHTLLTIADLQKRCNDPEGAKATVKEAVVFCDGIPSVSTRSFRLAQCAGLFAGLGDTNGWNQCIAKALGAAGQKVRPGGSFLVRRRKSIVQCVAYTCAGDTEGALPYLRSLEQDVKKSSGGSIESVGTAYGLIAFATGKRSRIDPDPRLRQLFERCYVSACAYLMCLPCNHHVDLAMADALAGASGRAWVGAVGLPDPESRMKVMTLVIRDACTRGQLEEARKMLTYVANAQGAPQAASCVAEAEVRFGNRSFETLKRWAEGLPTTADKAAALIGIAAGVKAGVSRPRQDTPQQEQAADSSTVEGVLKENAAALYQSGDHSKASGELAEPLAESSSDTRIRDLFDQSPASLPARLLDQAILMAKDVEDPCVQACLWLQIALAQRNAGLEDGYVASVEKTKSCCIVTWNKILDGRLPPEKYFDGQYHWRRDRRRLDAESEAITAVLRVLMDLEQVQHDNGDTSEAIDTLLLAFRCTEQLPRENVVHVQPKVGDSWSWMTRIAGRLAHRGPRAAADRGWTMVSGSCEEPKPEVFVVAGGRGGGRPFST